MQEHFIMDIKGKSLKNHATRGILASRFLICSFYGNMWQLMQNQPNGPRYLIILDMWWCFSHCVSRQIAILNTWNPAQWGKIAIRAGSKMVFSNERPCRQSCQAVCNPLLSLASQDKEEAELKSWETGASSLSRIPPSDLSSRLEQIPFLSKKIWGSLQYQDGGKLVAVLNQSLASSTGQMVTLSPLVRLQQIWQPFSGLCSHKSSLCIQQSVISLHWHLPGSAVRCRQMNRCYKRLLQSLGSRNPLVPIQMQQPSQ